MNGLWNDNYWTEFAIGMIGCFTFSMLGLLSLVFGFMFSWAFFTVVSVGLFGFGMWGFANWRSLERYTDDRLD